MNSDRFATLVQSNPENAMFRFSYGEALFAENKFEDCIEHLRFCVADKNDWMLPHILLGKALIAINQKKEAIHYLERALNLAKEQKHEDPEAEVQALLAELA